MITYPCPRYLLLWDVITYPCPRYLLLWDVITYPCPRYLLLWDVITYPCPRYLLLWDVITYPCPRYLLLWDVITYPCFCCQNKHMELYVESWHILLLRTRGHIHTQSNYHNQIRRTWGTEAYLLFTVNSLRAKFLSRNITMYLQFLSFLHTDRTQVAGILPCVRKVLAYFTQSLSWLLMTWRCNSHDTETLNWDNSVPTC